MLRRFILPVAVAVAVAFTSASAAASSSAIHSSHRISDQPPNRSRRAFLPSGSKPPSISDASFALRPHRGGNIQRMTDEKYDISLSPLAFATIFGFLGGWTHVLCNKQFDVYTAMVSGHIVNMSIYIAEKNWKEALWRLSIIGSYFGGVAAGRTVELKCEKREKGDNSSSNGGTGTGHFKIIAPLVVAIFAISEKLTSAKIALLTFGYGLMYPSVSASLGGTITHLMTGHTTSVARNLGANTMRNQGVKTSVCLIGSIVIGGIFGTKVLGALGDDFPYFGLLGVLYALALLLL